MGCCKECGHDWWQERGRVEKLTKQKNELQSLLQRAFEFGCLIPHPPRWVKEAETLLANTGKDQT